MATFINEELIINNNAFKFEDTLNSQYTRFLDKPLTFVTYYTINNVETTVDEGLQNIEDLLGQNSPLRFNKVNSLPVYGLDEIEPMLSDEEEGLTSEFDSELVLLPNTVTPKPNDFFIFNHVRGNFLFMVTNVSYDTIKSNNFYKISYTLKFINDQELSKLERQTVDNFDCVYKNIGTEDKCLIASSDNKKIKEFLKKQDELTKMYFILFYDEKTNSLLLKDEYCTIYDKYLSHFIMESTMLSNQHDYKTILFMNEDYSNLFPIEYEKSIYRVIEKRDKSKVPEKIKFFRDEISFPESAFNMLRIRNVKSVRFGEHKFLLTNDYINPDLLRYIKENILEEVITTTIGGTTVIHNGQATIEGGATTSEKIELSPIYRIIVKYFNNIDNKLYIDDVRNIDMGLLDYNLETYILIPIILYIMYNAYKTFVSK